VLAARGPRPGEWVACLGAELWRANAGEPTFERIPLELANPDPRDGSGCAALQVGFVSGDELWVEGPGGAVVLQREQWVVAADAFAVQPAVRPLRAACAAGSSPRAPAVTVWPTAREGGIVLAPLVCDEAAACPPPLPRLHARASGVLAQLDLAGGGWQRAEVGNHVPPAAESASGHRALGAGWDIGLVLTLGWSPALQRARAVDVELTRQRARTAAREALRCTAR